MDLASKLKELGITQAQVAQRARIKRATVGSQLRGRCRIKPRVERAARALLEEAEARRRAGEEAVRALRAARAKRGAGEVAEAVNP